MEHIGNSSPGMIMCGRIISQKCYEQIKTSLNLSNIEMYKFSDYLRYKYAITIQDMVEFKVAINELVRKQIDPTDLW